MSYQITEQSKGKWLATRGNANVQLTDSQLYKFLVQKKAAGFSISFYSNK